MTVMAVRTYEPWSATSLMGLLILIGFLAAVAILVLRRANR